MRQFLLGGNVAYASGSDLSKVAAGAVGVFYNNNGVLTASTEGTEFDKEAMLVLGRANKDGGPVVLPIYKNKFSYVKSVYSAAKTFTANLTIPAPVVGEYSVMVVRKGVKFNERNKWTAVVYVSNASTTATELCAKLAAAINANNANSGVTAEAATSKLTITAVKAGEDYEVIGADNLMGVTVTTTHAEPALNDAAYVKDLADKAAADAGFEYTYRDAYYEMYPKYPLNPLAQSDNADTGFTVFTLKFAEPRQTRTTDEVIHQIVQVAFPTGAAQIATFETVCKGMNGEAVASGDSE